MEVIRMDTTSFTEYVASLHARQNVEIRARVNGYLERLLVDEGAHVKKDQLLFTINNKEHAEDLAKARAVYRSMVVEADVAQLELRNTMALADKKIISNTEVELAKNKLEAQKSKIEEAAAHQAHAQLRLSNTEIRAPFEGILNRIPYKIGSLIEEGTLLTTISDNTEIYAYFDVSEKEYLAYARNLRKDSVNSRVVTLILADGSAHQYPGVIETIEGEIDENTGNIAFRAKFRNPQLLIKHGSSGKVRLRKRYDDVLVIPQKSTFEIQDKIYVYTVDQRGKLHVREIKTSHRLPHLFIIESGLRAGEHILYEGVQDAREGMQIKPQEMSFRQIIEQLHTQ